MNIRYLKVWLLLSVWASYCMATTEEIFLRGNSFYAQEAYEDALACYESIDNKGPAVWYNMGQCAVRLDRSAYAVLFFERAKRHAPEDIYRRSQQALQTLYKELKQEELQSTEWLYYVCAYTGLIPIGILQLLFLLAWFGLFIGLAIKSCRLRSLLLLCSAIIALGVSIPLGVRYYDAYAKKGIIVDQSVTLYAGPNEGYHELCTLSQAECVRIVREHDTWYNIVSKQGSGWLPQKSVVRVE